MIAKGTTHNNGAKLARYMTTGKEGERAELWELCGFAAGDIRDAFRSVHVMAEATRCEQPFFHVQVRNPEGEELSRDQWRRVADRIESKLGLSGQPRAIAFHADLATGHEHMHLAWSRIDGETMTARPLPFYKERLKEVSRELENMLDLTRVRNERDGSVLAPTRDEFEQARRLGVNIKDVRQTIRDCFERSDTGRSFEAALADHGFVLAQGDRRAFLVIDHEGGMHALGQRILGITAGQTRERLADLSRDELPTVEQAISFVREQQLSRERVATPPMRDPVRDEMAWQDALARAAIEKEKVEGRFVEPKAGRDPLPNPFEPPKIPLHPMLDRTPPELWFEDVAKHLTGDKRAHDPPESLRGAAAHIWIAYNRSHDATGFAAALNEHSISLAAVTKEEADRSHRESVFAKEIGRFGPTYREGEVVAVTEGARVYKLNERTTGDKRPAIEKFLVPLDRAALQGIDATKQLMHDRAAAREAHATLADILHPVEPREIDSRPTGRPGRTLVGRGGETGLRNTLENVTGVYGRSGRVVGKALDIVGNALESLLAPTLTPEQKRDGAQAALDRSADAANQIDLSRYIGDRALSRQRQEQEREASSQRERNERER